MRGVDAEFGLVEAVRGELTPTDACSRLLGLPYLLLLENATLTGEPAPFSFLTADPFLVLRFVGGRSECLDGQAVHQLGPDPFLVLRGLLSRFASPKLHPDLPPFQGGVAGYFGYGLARTLERLPAGPDDDLGLPDLCLGFFDWVLAWDHRTAKTWLISTGLPEPPGQQRQRRACERLRSVRNRLETPSLKELAEVNRSVTVARSSQAHRVPGHRDIFSDFSREDYLRAVQRTRDYIHAGDIFQANLSQRLSSRYRGHPFNLYRTLCRRNPAPFAAYFEADSCVVVSASPERFLRVTQGAVETRPIKGTAPRAADAEADRRFANDLLRSEKDRAENIMIVDLLRNDLSKVCEDDSVEVSQLCALETHPTVHHLASTIIGRLNPRVDVVDLLRASFPGGSVTGAPKIRAMEVLAQLERTPRGVYTGAIGYLGFDGSMDTSIAIRTMILRNGHSYFRVGGGIVADSDPVREYDETLHKARGLLAALEFLDGASD